jgi:hypothetical protein
MALFEVETALKCSIILNSMLKYKNEWQVQIKFIGVAEHKRRADNFNKDYPKHHLFIYIVKIKSKLVIDTGQKSFKIE